MPAPGAARRARTKGDPWPGTTGHLPSATGDGQEPPEELVRGWERARESLTKEGLSVQQGVWLGLTKPLGLVGDTALIATPNEFTRELLSSRLRPYLTTALSAAMGREVRVAVVVEPEVAGSRRGAGAEDDDEPDRRELPPPRPHVRGRLGPNRSSRRG